MKYLVFDTSSIISIVTNDLLWTIKPLKEIFKGEFYVPQSVKLELVDKPLTTKMFKLEAIMMNKSIEEGNFTVNANIDANDLMNKLNSLYSVSGKNLHLVDLGEVEALVLALKIKSSAYVVDERTMRLMIEDPYKLKDLLERKLHTKVEINKNLVKEIQAITKEVKVIRSTDLMLIAYEKGLLNKFITSKDDGSELLEALLWGLKLRGCSISTDEIEDLIKFESK